MGLLHRTHSGAAMVGDWVSARAVQLLQRASVCRQSAWNAMALS